MHRNCNHKDNDYFILKIIRTWKLHDQFFPGDLTDHTSKFWLDGATTYDVTDEENEQTEIKTE